jgi:hypothetical protein
MNRNEIGSLIALVLAVLAALWFFMWRAGEVKRIESPAVLDNIGISVRFVARDQLDSLVPVSQPNELHRLPHSRVYVVASAWFKSFPAERFAHIHAEFVTPDFLRGKSVPLPAWFTTDAAYSISSEDDTDILKDITPEQRKTLLAITPTVRVISATRP